MTGVSCKEDPSTLSPLVPAFSYPQLCSPVQLPGLSSWTKVHLTEALIPYLTLAKFLSWGLNALLCLPLPVSEPQLWMDSMLPST